MFKRALIAAIAVLMMPALAMAQSTSSSTFPVRVDFAPVAPDPAPSFGLNLTCNGGTPLSQDFTAEAGIVYNPVVIGAAESAGTLCDFSLTGDLPAGWDVAVAPTCEDIVPVADGASPDCSFVVFPTPFTFWVNVDFEAIGEASDVEIGGTLSLTCEDVWAPLGPRGSLILTTLSTSLGDYAIGALPNGLNPLSANLDYHADPLERTECYASLDGTGSAVEVDDSGCDPYEVLVGDPVFIDFEDLPRPGSEEVSICEIQATAFFEGIPTLSQYGMAIMALLMLGVGFFGFRRFV